MVKKRRIRLGAVGLGRAFSLMLPTFLGDQRVDLVAGCDSRETARRQFVKDFGRPGYESIESLVKNDDVEALYIASPHGFHAEHVRIAAMYGKHVLVEKPIALTLEECDAMIRTCRDAGVQLIVGHCHSFDAPYLQTRNFIETGKWGRVRQIVAINYTDFLYRPRRPEELMTEAGGGVVFSQASHQVDIVRLLAGARATRVRAVMGAWDSARLTEGAYSALLWFDEGSFASLTYSGYAHFDSDEWCGWVDEMGFPKQGGNYGIARKRLRGIGSSIAEARLKAEHTYGGAAYKAPSEFDRLNDVRSHQHFGPIIVSCESADLRPTPDSLWVYSDESCERHTLAKPLVPRFEVIDELYSAIVLGIEPIHSGRWAKSTLEICLAMLESSRQNRDIQLEHQVKWSGGISGAPPEGR